MISEFFSKKRNINFLNFKFKIFQMCDGFGTNIFDLSGVFISFYHYIYMYFRKLYLIQECLSFVYFVLNWEILSVSCLSNHEVYLIIWTQRLSIDCMTFFVWRISYTDYHKTIGGRIWWYNECLASLGCNPLCMRTLHSSICFGVLHIDPCEKICHFFMFSCFFDDFTIVKYSGYTSQAADTRTGSCLPFTNMFERESLYRPNY